MEDKKHMGAGLFHFCFLHVLKGMWAKPDTIKYPPSIDLVMLLWTKSCAGRNPEMPERSPQKMAETHNDPQKTSVFSTEIDPDGRFKQYIQSI